MNDWPHRRRSVIMKLTREICTTQYQLWGCIILPPFGPFAILFRIWFFLASINDTYHLPPRTNLNGILSNTWLVTHRYDVNKELKAHAHFCVISIYMLYTQWCTHLILCKPNLRHIVQTNRSRRLHLTQNRSSFLNNVFYFCEEHPEIIQPNFWWSTLSLW